MCERESSDWETHDDDLTLSLDAGRSDHFNSSCMVRSVECAPRKVSVGLRPFVACGDSSSQTPPACRASHSSWAKVQRHNGTEMEGLERGSRCAQQAIEAYICSLPARVGDDDLKPADWAFGADPPSVGKFVAHFALQLYLSTTQLSRPFRHVLPADALQGWRWRPRGGCHIEGIHTDRIDAWIRPDVCAGYASTRQRQSDDGSGGSAKLAQLLLVARGNSSGDWSASADPLWVATKGGGSTGAGLWLAGQLVRLVWRNAQGPCTRARVTGLLEEPYKRLRSVEEKASGARWSIAMHIRRGDACQRWGASRTAEYDAVAADPSSSSSSPARRSARVTERPCFHARDYLDAARMLMGTLRQRRGRRRRAGAVPWLLVASDSAEAVAELGAIVDPREFVVLQASGPRGTAWGGVAEGANLKSSRGKRAAADEFIEARNERGLVDRAAVVASLFADVELLSRADAFVGTAASFTSRVALFSIVGEKGSIPPFIMIDRPLKELWFA